MALPVTVINPIWTDGNGFAHVVATAIQRDDTTGEIFVQSSGPVGQLGYGVAVFDHTGALLRSALVNAGTAVPDTSVACQFGIAPNGSKIVGATPNGAFAEAGWFVLNRTTLAHVQNTLGGGSSRLLAVSPGEIYSATQGGKTYNVTNNNSALLPGGATPYCQVFSSDSTAWFGGGTTLLQYSISGNLIISLLNTFTPIANGANMVALSYNSNLNILVMWYDNGDIYPWNLSNNTIGTKIGTFSNPTGGFGIFAQLVIGNDKADQTGAATSKYAIGSAGNVYLVTPGDPSVKIYSRSLWASPGWTEALNMYEPIGNAIWSTHTSDGVSAAGIEILGVPTFNTGRARIWGDYHRH